MKEYITSILYMTIVTSLVHQILPSERYSKLIGTVCGFLLILVFLHPLLAGGVEQELRHRYQLLSESFTDSFDIEEDSFEHMIWQNMQVELGQLLRQVTGEEMLETRIYGEVENGEYQISRIQIRGMKNREQYQSMVTDTIVALYGEGVTITYMP